MAKTNLTKKATVSVKTKLDKEYSYKYTELADINEYIESIGERYYQFIDVINGVDYIMTQREVHDGTEWVENGGPRRGCKVVAAPVNSDYSNPAQEQGSALTYARRYSLLMAYGLATEDDDASKLSRPKESEINTLEEARNFKITFGTKHKGKLLGNIFDTDPSYIEYLSNWDKAEPTLKKCLKLLKASEAEDYSDMDNRIRQINDLMLETNADYEEFCKYFNVTEIEELTDEQKNKALTMLETKKAKMPKKEVF